MLLTRNSNLKLHPKIETLLATNSLQVGNIEDIDIATRYSEIQKLLLTIDVSHYRTLQKNKAYSEMTASMKKVLMKEKNLYYQLRKRFQ